MARCCAGWESIHPAVCSRWLPCLACHGAAMQDPLLPLGGSPSPLTQKGRGHGALELVPGREYVAVQQRVVGRSQPGAGMYCIVLCLLDWCVGREREQRGGRKGGGVTGRGREWLVSQSAAFGQPTMRQDWSFNKKRPRSHILSHSTYHSCLPPPLARQIYSHASGTCNVRENLPRGELSQLAK